MILLRFFPILIMTSVFIYSCEVETQKLSQKDVTFFGTGKEIRDYLHINDFSVLIKNILNSNTYNPIRTSKTQMHQIHPL